MWQKTVEKEMKQMEKIWRNNQVMAKDWQMWKNYLAALHATKASRVWCVEYCKNY